MGVAGRPQYAFFRVSENVWKLASWRRFFVVAPRRLRLFRTFFDTFMDVNCGQRISKALWSVWWFMAVLTLYL